MAYIDVLKRIKQTLRTTYSKEHSDNIMVDLKNLMDCIGCESCSRVCPKGCLSHEPQALAA